MLYFKVMGPSGAVSSSALGQPRSELFAWQGSPARCAWSGGSVVLSVELLGGHRSLCNEMRSGVSCGEQPPVLLHNEGGEGSAGPEPLGIGAPPCLHLQGGTEPGCWHGTLTGSAGLSWERVSGQG